MKIKRSKAILWIIVSNLITSSLWYSIAGQKLSTRDIIIELQEEEISFYENELENLSCANEYQKRLLQMAYPKAQCDWSCK